MGKQSMVAYCKTPTRTFEVPIHTALQKADLAENRHD
jgi:hypothetical protein